MPKPTIYSKSTWVRFIHDSWSNPDGWRTDIRPAVLNDPEVKRAAFVLDDLRVLLVPMDEMRAALANAPVRGNDSIGPFNVNPHLHTVNGKNVSMEIRQLEIPE